MSEKPTRTAAEIEAELEATRLALTNTVNDLHYRLKPSTQLNNAKESAKSFLNNTAESAKKLGEDAKKGETKAIVIIAGTVVGISLLIAIPFLRGRK